MSRTPRSAKMARVHASLKQDQRHDADQQAVWREVAFSIGASGAASPTHALADAYAKRDMDLSEFRRGLKMPEGAVGLAVFQNGLFQGLDLFDRHSTLKYFWDSLVDSYALDLLAEPMDPERPPKTAEAQAMRRYGSRVVFRTWLDVSAMDEKQFQAFLKSLPERERSLMTTHSGGTAFLATLIFDETGTVMSLCSGDITGKEFMLESGANLVKSLAAAAVTWGVVALGATPGGLVVAAACIGTQIIVSKAFQAIEAYDERQHLSLRDFIGTLPESLRSRITPFTPTGRSPLEPPPESRDPLTPPDRTRSPFTPPAERRSPF